MHSRSRHDESSRTSRKPSYKGYESWGTLNHDEVTGRRVYLKFNHRVFANQILEFFKDTTVKGIHVHHYYAYVEFDRPNDVTKALAMDGRRIGNAVISVQMYKPRKEKHKTRTEPYCSTSSRHRDSKSVNSDRQTSSGVGRTNDGTNQQHTFGDNQLVPVLDRQISLVVSQAQQQQQPNNYRRPFGDLPADIELSLKFVIEQKTAKNLSAIQIHDIMRYFEHVKKFVSSNSSLQLQVPYNHEQIPLQCSTGTAAGFGSLASVPTTVQLTPPTPSGLTSSTSNGDFVSSHIPAQICSQATSNSTWYQATPPIMAITDGNTHANYHQFYQAQQQSQLQQQQLNHSQQRPSTSNNAPAAITYDNQLPSSMKSSSSSSATKTITTTTTTTTTADPIAKKALELLNAAWEGC